MPDPIKTPSTVVDHDSTVFVVFPVHNRIKETIRFLESLSRQTVINHRLVICDDGSTDGTGGYISRHYPDAIVLKGNGHLWWTAGMNRCVQYVLSHCNKTDYVLTLNNDSVLPEHYIEQKLERARKHPNAIIGSLCVYADDETVIETSGYIVNFDKCKVQHLTKPGDVRNETHRGVVKVTYLPGKGVLFPVRVFTDVGLYDEKNLPQYHADTDLVLRAHKIGYDVLLDYDSVVLSEVNTRNMVLPTHEVTLRGIIKTFIGPYSMNNFRVYNYFGKKHFPGRRARFLLITYFRTIGGLIRRYIRYKLGGGRAVL